MTAAQCDQRANLLFVACFLGKRKIAFPVSSRRVEFMLFWLNLKPPIFNFENSTTEC